MTRGASAVAESGRHPAARLGDGRRKTFYVNTRGAAAEKLRHGRYQRALGLPVVGERLTRAQHLATWVEETARRSLRPRTCNLYSMIVEGHLLPAPGRARPVKLTPRAIEKYGNGKLADGLSATPSAITTPCSGARSHWRNAAATPPATAFSATTASTAW